MTQQLVLRDFNVKSCEPYPWEERKSSSITSVPTSSLPDSQAPFPTLIATPNVKNGPHRRMSIDLSKVVRGSSENISPGNTSWRKVGANLLKKGRQSCGAVLEAPLRTWRRIHETDDETRETLSAKGAEIKSSYVCLVGIPGSEIDLAVKQLVDLEFVVEDQILTDANRHFIRVGGGESERLRLLQRRKIALLDESRRTICLIHVGRPIIDSEVTKALEALTLKKSTSENEGKKTEVIGTKREWWLSWDHWSVIQQGLLKLSMSTLSVNNVKKILFPFSA